MPRNNRVASEKQEDPKKKAPPKAARSQSTTRARSTTPKTARKGAAASEPSPDLVKATPIKTSPRLLERYRKEVVPALVEEFGYKNRMEVPSLVKIVLNIGLGEVIVNSRAPEVASRDLTIISGQHPVTTKARKSIAAFKLREGMPIGLMVTLRGSRMYYFMDRLINAALPRIRDFRGVSRDAFDGRGNYSLGIREQVIFPEIDYSQIDRIRGFQVSIVTTARTDREGLRLLELLGMPFAHAGVTQRQTA